MWGAIAGDVIGSVYEGSGHKRSDFPLFSAASTFTDDSVLTVAVADALLRGTSYTDSFHTHFARWPGAGFGASFARWAAERRREPYGSYGNGAAMRVSPVAYARDDLDAVLREAERCAAATHDHPEGIRGAQATAAAIFLARTGASREVIRRETESRFGYDLGRRLRDIRPRYQFDVSCQGSVPESILAFLEASSFEDAIRGAVSLGGDADTMAAIAGSIAEPFFGGVPRPLLDEVRGRLDPQLARTVDAFRERHAAAVPPAPAQDNASTGP